MNTSISDSFLSFLKGEATFWRIRDKPQTQQRPVSVWQRSLRCRVAATVNKRKRLVRKRSSLDIRVQALGQSLTFRKKKKTLTDSSRVLLE